MIRTLLHNEIVNDYNKRLRINSFVGMTDISGCFDRIVVPVISILNIKNGCPDKAVAMLSTTLEMAKYHLKTKQGISPTTSYSHSNNTPVYGNGQGAGDSPSQWCQQSAMLFELYSNEHQGTSISQRDGSPCITLPMAAFADDTNLIGNDDDQSLSLEELVHKVQASFTMWNELLYSTRHFMELAKCSCYLSVWDFQEDGYAFTIPPSDLRTDLIVKDIKGNTQKIPQLSTNTSQKLLDVMKNPLGNQQDEIERLKTKRNNMAVKINTGAMFTTQAKMAYESFYVPAIQYSPTL
jgi:hypothetical protein